MSKINETIEDDSAIEADAAQHDSVAGGCCGGHDHAAADKSTDAKTEVAVPKAGAAPVAAGGGCCS